MSVTIADILKLPSMQGAKVVAGEENLGRTISCITVLECDDPEMFDKQKTSWTGFVGTELVITGFLNTRDNVDRQCYSIEKLNHDGQAGLILFYLGIGVSKLDKRVAGLARELGFPLICMPENRIEQRYGEVIYEVMASVVKDERANTYFASQIMERISHLPKDLRNMDSVLNMLRDRIHCSILIADMSGNLLNIAVWPSGGDQPVLELLRAPGPSDRTKPYPAEVCGKRFMLCKNHVVDENGIRLQLVLAKESDSLTEDTCQQVGEVVQTFLNIWSEKHGAIETEELIKAILNDEPVKMRRIAEILKIDVTEFSTMWIFMEEAPAGMVPEVKAFLKAYSRNYIAAAYEETVVAFISRCSENEVVLAEQMLAELEKRNCLLPLTVCMNLDNTMEARTSYLTTCRHYPVARVIYPGRKLFTYSEICFAGECSAIVEAGQEAIQEKRQILRPVLRAERGAELLETLKVYLLDAECSIAQTAERMFVHKNTIKYRVGRLENLLGYEMDRAPELRRLYTAAALERLLEIMGK